MSKAKEALLNPIFNDNPIALQILGICSALAVTGTLYITLIMCVALTSVVTLSNFFANSVRFKECTMIGKPSISNNGFSFNLLEFNLEGINPNIIFFFIYR